MHANVRRPPEADQGQMDGSITARNGLSAPGHRPIDDAERPHGQAGAAGPGAGRAAPQARPFDTVTHRTPPTARPSVGRC